MKLFSQENLHLKLPNAELNYSPSFYSTDDADFLYRTIKEHTNWQQDDITVFGKTYKQPRLTALYGESNQSYTYSNITMHPQPFPREILNIKSKIENTFDIHFNTVLLNLYRDGNDSNGWHADNEKELGKNPVIASLSLGAIRSFHFKHRRIKEERYKIDLHHGSLLLMKGEMQHYWVHQIPKTKRKTAPRINLTFRLLTNT